MRPQAAGCENYGVAPDLAPRSVRGLATSNQGSTPQAGKSGWIRYSPLRPKPQHLPPVGARDALRAPVAMPGQA
ncbi:hypothetical protein BO443_50215 [Burkholderia orbicola]